LVNGCRVTGGRSVFGRALFVRRERTGQPSLAWLGICDAFFLPRILDEGTIKARGVIISESGTQVVPRLANRLADQGSLLPHDSTLRIQI